MASILDLFDRCTKWYTRPTPCAAAFERTAETLQLALDGCSKLHARMQAVLAEKAKKVAVSSATIGVGSVAGEKRGHSDLAKESADAESSESVQECREKAMARGEEALHQKKHYDFSVVPSSSGG
eukprot:6188419-Pleurochrysis_carterae.AAC.6